MLVLEGPRKPWWLTPLVCLASLVAAMIIFNSPRISATEWLLAADACVFVATTWWMFVRVNELRYWEGVAQSKPYSCIVCGYDLSAATTPRCPECGVSFDEYVAKAKRLTGDKTSPLLRSPPRERRGSGH